MNPMFAPWRLPKLDRIGEALFDYQTCRCRECRLRVMAAIVNYDRGRK